MATLSLRNGAHGKASSRHEYDGCADWQQIGGGNSRAALVSIDKGKNLVPPA
jgi:hypothetical protein